VFDAMPLPMQDTLLTTSVLPNVTGAWAERLSGQAGAREILATLHARRLFTERRARVAEEESYEYHPLFRELLLERLRRERPDELSGLPRRAAALLEEAGEAVAAASLFLAVQDWSELTRLVEQQAPVLFAQGRLTTIEAWILAVPEMPGPV
jgi:LuxR family transcriptional regulator, maltose regulon positive regulatory protein